MRFIGPSDREFVGRSYEDIVFRMSEEKMREPRSQKSYRRAVARRTGSAYNVTIDPASAESFVKSLVEAGLLTRIK